MFRNLALTGFMVTTVGLFTASANAQCGSGRAPSYGSSYSGARYSYRSGYQGGYAPMSGSYRPYAGSPMMSRGGAMDQAGAYRRSLGKPF